MSIIDKILSLTRQLYPTGRAFNFPQDGYTDTLHNALAISEEQAFEDAMSILYSILPDNDNFTEDDASQWEQRLGLIVNPSVLLVDRKAAIQRKMNHPGTIPARQNYRYLEGQLRAAGFDVYVYENRFFSYPEGYVTMNPLYINGGIGAVDFEYDDFEYGESSYGAYYQNIIANHIDETIDWLFNIGDNFRSTFFIGGPILGSFADVDSNRKDEFRQLILKIKPVQEVAYLFINYNY